MAGQVDMVLIGFSTKFLAGETGQAVLLGLGFVGIAIVLTTVLAWLASVAPAIRGATSAQRILLASGRI
jgi:hypothetical protein